MSDQDNTEALNKEILTGGCLCSAVRYQVINKFTRFFLCHCQQCKQLSGSAFAANIFIDPENIEWLTGYEKISFYEHPSREFSKAFCSVCGSALPFINKSGKSMIIPAGSLFDEVKITPEANIFVNEKANWLNSGLAADEFNHFSE